MLTFRTLLYISGSPIEPGGRFGGARFDWALPGNWFTLLWALPVTAFHTALFSYQLFRSAIAILGPWPGTPEKEKHSKK